MPSSDIEDFVKGFEDLDWDLAIRRNRDQLRQIVLALFALAGGLTFPRRGEVPGLAGRRGVFPLFLPRSTIALIMLVLRPAESAVRRLIVIVAETSGTVYSILRANPANWDSRLAELSKLSPNFLARTRAFPLFDPLKSFDPDSIWNSGSPYKSDFNLTKSTTWRDASAESTPVDATHIGHRLNAVLRALNDLPRQARRLKRWELKRDAALKASKPTRFSPMRPGLPPGWRERRIHDIDEVLKECHRLANDRLDSS